MKKIPSLFYLLLLFLFTGKSSANTEILLNQQYLKFDKAPLLAEVLANIENKQNIYWPAATFYSISDKNIEITRNIILKRLSAITKNKQTDEIINSLKRTLLNWHIAERLPIKINYDLARTVNAHNPVITAGQYILSAYSRSSRVIIFGALKDKTELIIPHKNHTLAADYITDDMLSSLADTEQMVLIQADGRIIEVDTLDWNKTPIEAMPGSQIYIPFKVSFGDNKMKLLNQQIITLAVNRVMP
ncbi:capsule biosynthesis GfcC family protein [Paraglaciecola sp. L3A3]|uniref:capsule biosynthesis GfcC family protein n=1 Tax=Paraglaciecola sp. L3A3 TaxID=2686358 RepID=UPI00131D394D|nr:capsule biosynthesis GfcC family protein [Paraglaciecola sp. L3A3]